MAVSQGAATARERLRRISSTMVDPSVITLRRDSISQDGSPHARSFRRSTDAEQGVREPLLSPFAGQETPEQHAHPDAGADVHWKCTVATWASLAVNFFLLAAKLWGFAVSQSYSVLASAADSIVDIASQAVLALADWQVGKVDARYPVGRTRLQTVAVIACAVIMSFATLAVIQESGKSLYTGIATGIPPDLDMTWLLYVILGVAAGLKVILYLYCVALQKQSESMLALAEDHRNDIMSNVVAILTGAAASYWREGWWIDPVGGILISLYIIYSWGAICKEQVDKMIGKGAPEDFIHNLEQLASTHHADMSLDHIRAYYFGQRFIVEMEVVLPPRMTVRESHDIAMILQHKLEALEEVERAFVHVDYTKRDEPEHKVERNLMSHPKDLMLPHQDVAESSGTAAEMAEQSKKAAELHDHLQHSNSVSDQAKRAAKKALEAEIPDANGDENV